MIFELRMLIFALTLNRILAQVGKTNGNFYTIFKTDYSQVTNTSTIIKALFTNNKLVCINECNKYSYCMSCTYLDSDVTSETNCYLFNNTKYTLPTSTSNTVNINVKYYSTYNEQCNIHDCNPNTGLLCNASQICTCNNQSAWSYSSGVCVPCAYYEMKIDDVCSSKLLKIFSSPTYSFKLTSFGGNTYGLPIKMVQVKDGLTNYYCIADASRNFIVIYDANMNYLISSVSPLSPYYLLQVGTYIYLTSSVGITRYDLDLNVQISVKENLVNINHGSIVYDKSKNVIYNAIHNSTVTFGLIIIYDLNLTKLGSIGLSNGPNFLELFNGRLYIGTKLSSILVMDNTSVINTYFNVCRLAINNVNINGIEINDEKYMIVTCHSGNKVHLYYENGTYTDKYINITGIARATTIDYSVSTIRLFIPTAITTPGINILSYN